MTRDKVFQIIKKADRRVLRGQEAGGVQRIEHIVPFVDGDLGLDVWAFYATDEDRKAAEEDGRTSAFRSQYLEALRKYGYDDSWFTAIGFTFDSVENVKANYEGNFYFRLR